MQLKNTRLSARIRSFTILFIDSSSLQCGSLIQEVSSSRSFFKILRDMSFFHTNGEIKRFPSKTCKIGEPRSKAPRVLGRSKVAALKPLKMGSNMSGLILAASINPAAPSFQNPSTRCTDGIKLPTSATPTSPMYLAKRTPHHSILLSRKVCGSREDGLCRNS